MRKLLRKLLILIVVINFAGMLIEGSIIDNNKVMAIKYSMEKSRLDTIKEKGAITVTSALYDYPFFDVDPKTNKISGIDADILTEIAKRLGITKIELRETKFINLLNELVTDNSVDVAAGGIYITPEREELVEFTKPLYKESETVVVPKFSNINFMDNLQNGVIGVEKGTVYVGLAQKWKENNIVKDVILYENTSDLLYDVNSEKIDAGLADSVLVNNYLSRDKKLLLRTLKDYTPELLGNIGIAVRKGDTELLNALNEKIDEIKSDGTLYAILIKNGLSKSSVIIN